MKVLITGSSNGIGKAIAEKFLEKGHTVIGLDMQPCDIKNPLYTHFLTDVCSILPDVDGVEIVVTSAGIQFPLDKAIEVNLKGTINVVEKYAFSSAIRSVVTIASSSGINGAEFAEYAASKGGVIAYTKNVALRIAKYGATANVISPGGVLTASNAPVLDDPVLREKAIGESLLKKWATPEEIAEWVYFSAVINKSMTGQNILVDNGEMLSSNFVWPE